MRSKMKEKKKKRKKKISSTFPNLNTKITNTKIKINSRYQKKTKKNLKITTKYI